METDKETLTLGDKKSYAGIPEAEFVVSNPLTLKTFGSPNSLSLLFPGRCGLVHV